MMYPINVVEQKTGINKFLLRMWERRYSFVEVTRNEKNERVYSAESVERLSKLKFLIDSGFRPSYIDGKNIDEMYDLEISKGSSKKENAIKSIISILSSCGVKASSERVEELFLV